MQDGTGRLIIPPAKVKEQLHEMPADYTAVDGMDDHSSSPDNGWHWGVAARLLMLLVFATFKVPEPPRTTLQWKSGHVPMVLHAR